jgi:hypothetical protein
MHITRKKAGQAKEEEEKNKGKNQAEVLDFPLI